MFVLFKNISVFKYSVGRKKYGKSECVDQGFLDLGTSWSLVVSFRPRMFNPKGKSSLQIGG
jgi:hypothetical protein